MARHGAEPLIRHASDMGRLGIYGGTFDPVHQGHLDLARFTLGQDIVDRILFVVSARPPHKSMDLTPFTHRYRMVQIALGNEKQMEACAVEAARPGPSYTVDTLRILRTRYPEADLVFLAGIDSLLDLHCWHRFETILELAELVVVTRPGIDHQQWKQAIKALPGDFVPDSSHRLWTSRQGAVIRIVEGLNSPFSSSTIRARLARGLEVDGLAEEVRRYIDAHHLYREDGSGGRPEL